MQYYARSRILPYTVLNRTSNPSLAWTWALLTSQYTDDPVLRICLRDLARALNLKYDSFLGRLRVLCGGKYNYAGRDKDRPILAEVEEHAMHVRMCLFAKPDAPLFYPRQYRKYLPCIFIPDFLFFPEWDIRPDAGILWSLLQDQMYTITIRDLRFWGMKLGLSRYRRKKAKEQLLELGLFEQEDDKIRIIQPEEGRGKQIPLFEVEEGHTWKWMWRIQGFGKSRPKEPWADWQNGLAPRS